MKRTFEYIAMQCRATVDVIRHELHTVLCDSGVRLVIVFALFIYSILYSLGYHNEVLRNVPIAVIDQSRTTSSRNLISLFDAGANTVVAYEAADMAEAERLFYDHKIYGIVLIPADYERSLVGGGQASVALYCDAGYFLMYRQVFQEVVTAIGATGTMVEYQRLVAKGINAPQAQSITQPVIYQSHNLFNPYLGYGTFIMPAIILIILQQTAIIGIGMIGGTWREQGLYAKMREGGRGVSSLSIVAGKTIAYLAIYSVTATYVLTLHYRLFGYPMNGSIAACVAVVVPYMLASILLGIALSTLFARREYSILFSLWTSIPILLLSGASMPKEAFPEWMYLFGQLFPSSSVVDAYIRVQTAGASIREVMPQIARLWQLVAVYGGLSLIFMHIAIRRKR